MVHHAAAQNAVTTAVPDTTPIAAEAKSAAPPAKESGSAVAPIVMLSPQPIDDATRWSARAKERSNARWALIVEKKFDAAYEFYTPASRALFPSAEHVAQLQGLSYLDGMAHTSECDRDRCKVDARASIYIQIPRIGPRKQTLYLDEHWVLINGEMWLLRR